MSKDILAEDSSSVTNKRGPYNRSKYLANVKVPKTTQWSRTKKNEESSIDQTLDYEDFIDADQTANQGDVSDDSQQSASYMDTSFHDTFDNTDTTDNEQNMKFADDEIDNSDSDEEVQDQAEAEDFSTKQNDEPLYHGARITLLESMVLIITFLTRHQLTREATKDLLHLIELHCLVPNLCRTSIHLFYNLFSEITSPVQRHFFCDFCHEYFGTESKVECPLCKKKKEKHFMYIPLASQLQSILSGLTKSDLQYRSARNRKTENNIEDVFDGEMYKKYFDGSYFVGTQETEKSKELHISLQMNTDGVTIFRSSSYSVWPLYLLINELSPKQRFNSENRIFAGLWFGEVKPVMNIFLAPLIQELSSLYNKGKSIILHGQQILLKALLMNVVCDAPARCLVQNFTQFNGFFGCGCCLAKGSSVKTSARGSMLSYPFEISDGNSQNGHSKLRTHSETVRHARDALVNGKPVFGVKGFTVLTNLPYFDIIRCVTVDYMHCVLLGVQKMLLQLWTDHGNKDETFYIGDYIGVLDDRMKALTSPNVINRSPRCMKELKHWKASEYRSFLLFHSICCLQDILPQEHYVHYLLFVEGIYLLLQSSVSRLDISRAKLLFAKFCAEIDYLYAQRYETYNVHCLLHLAEKVEDFGPLWSQSCFFFEDLNGNLSSLFHGTTKIELQIASAVVIHQQIPFLVKKVTKNSEVDQVYQRLKNSCKRQNREYINNHMLAVGRQIDCQLLPETRRLIELSHGPVCNVAQFYRLLSNGIMLHSKMYHSVTKRNSYTVEYTVNNMSRFGQIQYFLKTQTQSGIKYLAVIEPFFITECIAKLPCHFYEVTGSRQTDIIDVMNIEQMSYFAYLTTSKKCFIGKIPVFIESD